MQTLCPVNLEEEEEEDKEVVEEEHTGVGLMATPTGLPKQSLFLLCPTRPLRKHLQGKAKC